MTLLGEISMKKADLYIMIYGILLIASYYYLHPIFAQVSTIAFFIISIHRWGTKGGLASVAWAFGGVILLGLFTTKVELHPILVIMSTILSLAMVLGFGIPFDMLRKERKKRIESEETLKSITDNMLDIVVKINLDGKILYVSPSCEDTLGVEPKAEIGQNAIDRFHPEDKSRAIKDLSYAIKHKVLMKGEYRCLHNSGHYIWLESKGRLLYDEKGNPTVGIISSCYRIVHQSRWMVGIAT